jgi:hypothetical protein
MWLLSLREVESHEGSTVAQSLHCLVQKRGYNSMPYWRQTGSLSLSACLTLAAQFPVHPCHLAQLLGEVTYARGRSLDS